MIATQTKQILEHLKNIGPITPLECLNLYGCFRLGARIWDLKQQGINIHTEIVKDGNKHYARYSMETFAVEPNGQLILV